MLHPWLKKYPIKPDSKYLILGIRLPMPYCGKLGFIIEKWFNFQNI
jgi:hypothetical protein